MNGDPMPHQTGHTASGTPAGTLPAPSHQDGPGHLCGAPSGLADSAPTTCTGAAGHTHRCGFQNPGERFPTTWPKGHLVWPTDHTPITPGPGSDDPWEPA